MVRAASLNQLQSFLAEVRRLAPQARLLLFGSRARGQAASDSDYDLLVVLPHPADRALKATLETVSARLLLEEGLVLSVFLFSEEELERLRYEPFIQNALREGVEL